MYGWGDVLNPTAGSALDCGLLAGGVFNKACWCVSFPSWCSKDDYTAAVTLAHPENYVALKPPPVPSAPTGDALTVPPASGEEAQALVDKLLADQMRAWQEQNAGTMAETQANIDRIGSDWGKASESGGIPWYWWLIGGVGVFGLVSLSAGGPRRYGR